MRTKNLSYKQSAGDGARCFVKDSHCNDRRHHTIAQDELERKAEFGKGRGSQDGNEEREDKAI